MEKIVFALGHIFSICSTLYSFLWIQLSICCNFLFSCKTSFDIYFGAGLLESWFSFYFSNYLHIASIV